MRTGKRRPRPSYKTLYEALLKSMSSIEGREQYSDETPTHRVTIYDTIEWIYDIKVQSDEEAEGFDPVTNDDQIVGMEKQVYAADREWHSLRKE